MAARIFLTLYFLVGTIVFFGYKKTWIKLFSDIGGYAGQTVSSWGIFPWILGGWPFFLIFLGLRKIFHKFFPNKKIVPPTQQ